ncbi:CAP domain-containing protein [Nocardioides sp.]|uniref:CAP domain-containing protein n=1 Tax=Nocardioides sp. TaxID=35761 RepID=UPI00271992CC|nr:CAP domain-containing protein [Nocardioides sp.]MDO9456295.1 CAP domain-containing protein [Nocardioides sp.]
MSLLAATLLSLTVVSSSPASAASVGGDPSARRAARPTAYVSEVRTATNAERQRRHQRALTLNTCLKSFARKQAVRMARERSISHTSDFMAIGRRCGLSTWGENVAQALPNDRGRGVVRQWMRSSDHRANILNRQYRLIGMGAVRSHGAWWVVQVFGRKM